MLLHKRVARDVSLIGDGKGRPFDPHERIRPPFAGVRGLTFHDLRGSAVVRLAVASLTVPQIASFARDSLKDVEAILDGHRLSKTWPILG
jgi:hypothetical protein